MGATLGNQLTSDGFQFILQDTSNQVHHILLHYIKKLRARQANQVAEGGLTPVVIALQYLFNLSLADPLTTYYKLELPAHLKNDKTLQGVTNDLHELGLLNKK
jgi:hypothetical protein